MFIKNLMKSGWLHALFIGAIAFPLGAISSRIVAQVLHSHTLVYTVIITISAAIALLLRGGSGPLVAKTLKRPETWIYAIMQILVFSLAILIMKYVSATQGAGLFRVAGVFALLWSVLFLAQKAGKLEILGLLFILAGFFAIIKFANLTIEEKSLLALIVIARGISQSSLKVIAEVHKTNRLTETPKEQNRVVGFVMAVSGFLMLVFLLVIAWFKDSYGIQMFSMFPSFTDFIDLRCFLLAVFMGLVIVSFSKYCEFYAGKTIGAKYLTSILSLQIVFVYIFERVLAYFELMTPANMDLKDALAVGIILLGNIVICSSGFLKDLSFIKKGKQRDTLENLDDNFITSRDDYSIIQVNLSSILGLYDGDINKVSEQLDMTKMDLENILNYSVDEVKLKKSSAKKINNFASLNVSLRDKLTKAYNRYYLEQKTKSLFSKLEDFKLYYLDLNKFKPVNDDYGHEAGDSVLIQTVQRLTKLLSIDGFVVRLGGDEFVIVHFDLNKDITKEIIKVIEEPYQISETQSVNISTAVGNCDSTKANDLDLMLQIADKNMFNNKNKR